MNRDYKIEPVKTSKDEIRHPALAEAGVIAKLCCSTILVGKSGSGKSVLLHNLMTRKEFYAGHFDKVFLISPTGEADDVQKALGISPSCTFTDMDEAILCLRKIEAHQEAEIKKKGSVGAQKFCIIFDDVVVRFLLSFSFLFPYLTIFLGPHEAHEFPRVHWKFHQGHATEAQHTPHASRTHFRRGTSTFRCFFAAST